MTKLFIIKRNYLIKKNYSKQKYICRFNSTESKSKNIISFGVIDLKVNFEQLESGQINTITRSLDKVSSYQAIISNKETNLTQKQTEIEKLDLITRKDLAYDLQPGENIILNKIDHILLAPIVNYWNPKNINLLSTGKPYWGLKKSRAKKDHKFLKIFEFITALKSKLKKEFSKFVLYCMKAAMARFVFHNNLYSIDYNKLLTIFGQLLFKMGHSILGLKSSYYSIKANNKTLYSFCFLILGSIVDQYEKETKLITIEMEKKVSRKRIRSIRTVIISNHFSFGSKDLTAHQWPLLIPPKDWVKNDNGLNFGGYQCNYWGFYPGIHQKQECAEAFLQEGHLAVLNNLQKTPYEVNEAIIMDIKSNPAYLLSLLNEALPADKGYTVSILKMEGNCLVILPFRDTILFKTQQKGLYMDTFDLTWRYLFALLLIMALRNHTFYYAWFLDFRARAYSSGYPLSAQGDRFTRSLIKMKNTNEISLDASTQGLSLLALIVGEHKILTTTNVLVSSENPSPLKKEDLYLKISSQVSQKLEIFFNSDSFYPRIKAIKLKTKKGPVDEDGEPIGHRPDWDNEPLKTKEFLILFQEVIKDLKTDRKIMKSIIMCIAYNETSYGRVNKLIELLKVVMANRLGFAGEYFQEIWQVSYLMEEAFREVFAENCPEISQFIEIFNSKFLRDGIELNKGFVFFNTEVMKFSYYKPVAITTRVVKRGKTTVCTSYDKAQYSVKRAQRSMLSNFVHSLDAVINFKVVSHFQSKNILILSVHDCWVIDKKYEEELKAVYFEALLATLVNKDVCVIKQFMIDNKVNIEGFSVKLFLTRVLNNRKNLIQKIKSGELKMSPFILTE